MKKEEKISFALDNIATLQFAIIESSYSDSEEIQLNTNLGFGVDHANKIIGVSAKFTFEINTKPFLVIEVGCNFKLIESSWKSFINKDVFIVPKDFIQHLSVITIGTARGVLHAKTENTNFNRFLLPTINVTEIITEDWVTEIEKNTN